MKSKHSMNLQLINTFVNRSAEKVIIIIVVLLSLFFCKKIEAQTAREISYKAYVQGDLSEWLFIISEMENKSFLLPEEQIELIGYYYGYTGYLLGTEKRLAANYIKKGEALINEMLKMFPENASLLAYKGSFISFRIALSKFKAIALGPESMQYINRANKIDPVNVQALADKGNMLYYCPAIFGGNKKEALNYFQKAINQIEHQQNTYQNWFYLNLLALLGKYYQEMKMDEEANGIFQKALQFEPAFNWLQNTK